MKILPAQWGRSAVCDYCKTPIDPPNRADNLPDCLCPSHKPGPGTAWQNVEPWQECHRTPVLITLPAQPPREYYYHQHCASYVLAFAADQTGQPHPIRTACNKAS